MPRPPRIPPEPIWAALVLAAAVLAEIATRALYATLTGPTS